MLRSFTNSHNPSESRHHPEPSHNMEKDAANITTTVPDYHDGLHEKTKKLEHDNATPDYSNGGEFVVSFTLVLLNFSILTFTSALHQSTCNQQLWFHAPGSLGSCRALISACVGERWSRRSRIWIHARRHRLYTYRYGFGGNGLDGSHSRRTVPLVCTLRSRRTRILGIYTRYVIL
jgi:hypothetical protein